MKSEVCQRQLPCFVVMEVGRCEMRPGRKAPVLYSLRKCIQNVSE